MEQGGRGRYAVVMDVDRLPIHGVRDRIVAAVAGDGRLTLRAPTGSGKSTQTPGFLLESGAVKGRIVVLQPRRLPTRVLAHRVAGEMGTPVGHVVGYRTRHESVVSDATRIVFMTEGLLLRLMVNGSGAGAGVTLAGVGAVVLDEFHERSLNSDMLLGLVRGIRSGARPDLKIVVMSATLDTRAVSDYLGGEVVEAGGRSYPVEVGYLDKSTHRPVWDLATDAVGSVLRTHSEGDVLVFMPGVYEIRRAVAALRSRFSNITVHALHGQMTPGEQDAVMREGEARRVIVSTNVAETSLTIPGVRHVVDSGLARTPRFDVRRGINVLLVGPISKASADQRAGRAGRTAPGTCTRLWTKFEDKGRTEHTAPEVERLDMCEASLLLKSMGVTDVAAFDWITPPPPRSLQQAHEVLQLIGAVDEMGGLTPTGRELTRLPIHPRLGRVLFEARRRGCAHRAALWVALASERPITLTNSTRGGEGKQTGTSDFESLEHKVAAAVSARFDESRCASLGVSGSACREVVATRSRLLDALDRPGRDTSDDPRDTARCLLAGFPDHLAVRRNRSNLSCALSGQRGAELDRHSAVHDADHLIALDMREVSVGKGVKSVLSLAAAVEMDWLTHDLPGGVVIQPVTRWDEESKAAQTYEQTRWRDLVLGERLLHQTDPDAAAQVLADRVHKGLLKLEKWDEKCDQWIARVRCVGAWFPERSLLMYDESDLSVIVLELCTGCTRASQLRDKPVLDALRSALSWEDQRHVDQMAPTELPLPSGRKMKIEYAAGSPPRGRGKIQDFYGLTQTPRVAGGRVPVLLEILGPNFRPVQVTEDLAGFWVNLYPTLKKELQRRYPRHKWL